MSWKDDGAPKLDRLLRDAKISNVELATKMGLSDSTISRYRSGERVPDVDAFAYMLARAGGSADDVLGIGGSVVSRIRRNVLAAIDGEIQAADGDAARLATKPGHKS